jgi:hypothetical protein
MYMKKFFLIAGVLFFMHTAFAQQEVYDAFNTALPFSQAYYHLTARSSAMGGASGALPSDFGAVAVNPAAIATYRTSELTFTPEFYSMQSKTNYRSQVNSEYKNGVNVNQMGLVYSFQAKKSSPRYNFGFAYNKLNAFGTSELVQNIPPIDIKDSYWGQMAGPESVNPEFRDNNKPIDNINPNEKYLFSQDGTVALPSTNVAQRAKYSTTGFLGEYALSFGVNISENIYIGASAVLRDATKSLTYELLEESTDDEDYRYTYGYTYKLSGLGFGGKVGMLILPVPELMIGVSVQSPIFYSFTQRPEQRIIVHELPLSVDWQLPESESSTKYNLMTPMQVTLSLSYTFPNIALITLDYEMTPYAMTGYSNSNGDITPIDKNNDLLSESKLGSSARLGAEFYVWRGLAARFGGGYHTDPSVAIKSSANLGAGLGYDFGYAAINLSYVFRTQKQEYKLYTNSSPVEATYTKNFIALSLAYRF